MTPITATFLGTGTSQGVPVIACGCQVCQSTDERDKRTRTSLMLSKGLENIVIDSGPDFRQQMLREKVQNLEAIVFTHEHKDHIAGMDDIRAFNYQTKKAMEVFATEQVEEALKREFYYVFQEKKYPGIPKVSLNRIDDDPFTLMGEEILPLNVLHYKLPVKAFRVRDLAYITDANYITDDAFEKLQGIRILIINALRKEKHLSHFNLEEALEIVDLLKPEQTYLTHISHLMGTHKEVSEELPDGVQIAYDGLKFEF